MVDVLFEPFAMKSDPRRLATRQRPAYRKMMSSFQDGKDPITGCRLKSPCIDHDHDTGTCRLVLNRSTNTFEGKVRAFLIQLGLKPQRFAQPLFDVWLGRNEAIATPLYEIALEIWAYLTWEHFLGYIKNLGVYYATAWAHYDHLFYEKPPTTGQ